jgi:hypothetical protein
MSAQPGRLPAIPLPHTDGTIDLQTNIQGPLEQYAHESDDACALFREIAETITRGKMYAFVGAGVSVDSGLPDWDRLLKSLHTRVVNAQHRDEIQRVKDGNPDPIMLFELIRQSLGQDLLIESVVREFNEQKSRPDGLVATPVPNDLHHLVCRLPIRRIITTNYDSFLEDASKASGRKHLTFTREDNKDLYDAIMDDKQSIIKIHGDKDKPNSVVVTRRDYDRVYAGGFVNDWLEKSFIYNSFLFLGYSLRDIDIVSMIRHARASVDAKVKVGPHYGVFFPDTHGELLNQYLKDALSLKVTSLCDPRAAPPPTAAVPPDKSARLKAFLVALHGEVARLRSRTLPLNRDVQDYLQAQIVKIADSAWDIVGADEIRVSLCSSLDYKRLAHVYHRTPNQYDPTRRPVDPKSIVNHAFLLLRESEWIYLHSGVDAGTRRAFFPGASPYKSGLIVAISQGGFQIGLIEVYSVVDHAFSDGHLAALKAHSRLCADVFFDTHHKTQATNRSQPTEYDRILSLVTNTRLYQEYAKKRVKFILYNIDYEAGRLDCLYHKGDPDLAGLKGEQFSLGFRDESLASHVFNNGDTQLFVFDESRQIPGTTVRMSEAGVRTFGIRPGDVIYATTIRAFGYTSQILVGWLRPESPGRKHRTIFERIKRVVRLIKGDRTFRSASGGSEAERFMSAFDTQIASLRRWANQAASDTFYRSQLNTLTQICLTQLRFQKVRVWYLDPAQAAARIACSRVTERARFDDPQGRLRKAIDGYAGIEESAESIYTQFTLARYRRDPYARWQMKSMFDVADPKHTLLDKDPDGKWLTAPLVWNAGDKRVLIGFISADTHVRDSAGVPAETPPSDEYESEFQRCALDLISHVAVRCVAKVWRKDVLSSDPG